MHLAPVLLALLLAPVVAGCTLIEDRRRAEFDRRYSELRTRIQANACAMDEGDAEREALKLFDEVYPEYDYDQEPEGKASDGISNPVPEVVAALADTEQSNACLQRQQAIGALTVGQVRALKTSGPKYDVVVAVSLLRREAELAGCDPPPSRSLQQVIDRFHALPASGEVLTQTFSSWAENQAEEACGVNMEAIMEGIRSTRR